MSQFVQNTLTIQLIPRRSWFSLGPGWAVIGGVLASGALQFGGDFWALNASWLLPIIFLWLLVDPILGTFWYLIVERGVLQQLSDKASVADLRIKPAAPYIAKNSLGYRISAGMSYLQAQGDGVWQTLLLLFLLAFGLAALLGIPFIIYVAVSLLIALAVASKTPVSFGRQFWQATMLFLLPYVFGLFLTYSLERDELLLGLVYWLIYWGMLRLLAGQHTGERLVITGQAAAAIFLFALMQPIGGAFVSLAAVFTLLIRLQATRQTPAAWKGYAPRLHPFLLIGFLAAAISMGGGG